MDNILKNISLDDLHLAIIIVNDQHLIIACNKHVKDVFGYEKNELLGQDVDLLVPPENKANHGAHIDEYFKMPVVKPLGVGRNLQAMCKDQQRIPVEISLCPLDSGTPGGSLVLVSVIDIRVAVAKSIADALARLIKKD